MMEAITGVLSRPWVQSVLGLVALALVAALGNLLTQRVLLRMVSAFSERSVWSWDDALQRRGVFRRLGRMVPALIVQFGIELVPHLPQKADFFVRKIALMFTIFFGLRAVGAAITAVGDLYQESRFGKGRSVKGYVQLIKLVIYMAGAIVLVAAAIDQSPLILLSGFGAISAVLMLVFKDTILSVVASVQLASNDMLRVGDWIEMPSAGADGDVIDIALHTVKVKNWDKTITTIPTWRLISESYRNWRGMVETGGRRIKRAIHLDVATVRFLDEDEVEELARFRLIRDYLSRKCDDLQKWNEALGEPGKMPVNQRRLTNVGTFRAYAQAYIDAHPEVNHELTAMVRQLAPGPTGVPMEIYCFTASVKWAEYERVQGDIFDHLISILPEFGLAPFQQPSGADLRAGIDALKVKVPLQAPRGVAPALREPIAAKARD